MDRIRWHCRRGMLELDLVLNRFVQAQFERLDADQVAAFRRLLGYPDNELLDLVMGRAEAADAGVRAVLEQVRSG
jgi:succinate dehydrogenase flavin-adding protein (antitoxin of CptAB toxin-antitoxin module)